MKRFLLLCNECGTEANYYSRKALNQAAARDIVEQFTKDGWSEGVDGDYCPKCEPPEPEDKDQ